MSEGNTNTLNITDGHMSVVNAIILILAVLLIGYSRGDSVIAGDRVRQQSEIVRDMRVELSDATTRMKEQEELFRAWTTNVDRRIRELEKPIE